MMIGIFSSLLFVIPNAAADEGCQAGDSTEDRVGCLDSDGDGWSDADDNWTIEMGADVFPLDSGIWSDADGDGYADQGMNELSDNCPFTYGKSRVRLVGCSDIDGDFMPDIYDDDADGDGIRNEMERAASSGTILYDPYNPNSTPLDSDKDTIPDVIDDDNDNDGWPDLVELDRGSDILDASETPFNLYLGINTGIFYSGGLNGDSFSFDYDAESVELSISAFLEIVLEELLIPLLLVPTYFAIFYSRASKYRELLGKIENSTSKTELIEIEKEVNLMVKDKNIKVYHGLVLRNAIEEIESKFDTEDPEYEKKLDSTID
ncbi:MAG: hypothetical protein HN794_07150 [Euryarchaeota archaeon]|nr:hypothetical protein [Euryarchaeota archaeon]MBT7460804.1 hypothetical protein [Euryarchaeota archaeon]